MIASHEVKSRVQLCWALFLAPVCLLLFAACQTPDMGPIQGEHAVPIVPQELSPGDSLLITFPSATNLTGMHRVGADGAITLPYIGVVTAAGKTPTELEAELKQKYATELRDNQVLVTLTASSSIVYVNGAVLRPGPVEMLRPLTVLEAIMAAGGYDPDTANLKKVGVVRWENGQNKRYTLDLRSELQGQALEPFYLRPKDIVIVPQKIQWF